MIKKTTVESVIDEITKSRYSFDDSKFSFEYEARFDAKNVFFKEYNKRIWDSFNVYKANQNFSLPIGTYRFNHKDSSSEINLIGLIITPESVLYPSEVSEKKVFKLIGQAGLDILLCRKDSLKNGVCSSENADLSFSTEITKPTITYWFNDSTIEIQAKELNPVKEDYSWRNNGGVVSLLDLKEGMVSFSLADRISNELDDIAFQLSKHYLIYGFKMNVLSRIFASYKLCKISIRDYTQYYLKLPKEILQTRLNIVCQ